MIAMIGRLGIFRKSEASQQIDLALTLTRQIVSGKVCSDVRIGFRIPDVVIDTIRDSRETIATRAQQPVESVTLFWRLNLMCVTRAHGRECVSSDDSGFQRRGVTVQAEVVAFGWIAKAEPPEIAGIEETLIADVVK